MNELSKVFTNLMFLTREKMHFRGKIENNIIVFDLGLESRFVAGKFVKLIMDILERSFYGMTSKIYFFGSDTSMKYTIRTLESTPILTTRDPSSSLKIHNVHC